MIITTNSSFLSRRYRKVKTNRKEEPSRALLSMGDIEEPLPPIGVEWPYQKVIDRFKKRRSEASALIPVLEKLNGEEKSLAQAKTCLSIGPGSGYNDLDFLQKCLPNLKKYIALDKRCSMLINLKVTT